MRGSKARAIRKLVKLEYSKLAKTSLNDLANRSNTTILLCDETKRLYRHLKEQYKLRTDIGKEIQKDIGGKNV